MNRGNKPMPDSEAKKQWAKDNMSLIGLKLHNKKDADIINYLDRKGKEKQKVIKAAIREYMKAETAEDVFIPTDDDDDIILDPEMW